MHYNCEGNIDVQCCSRFNSIVAKDALEIFCASHVYGYSCVATLADRNASDQNIIALN